MRRKLRKILLFVVYCCYRYSHRLCVRWCLSSFLYLHGMCEYIICMLSVEHHKTTMHLVFLQKKKTLHADTTEAQNSSNLLVTTHMDRENEWVRATSITFKDQDMMNMHRQTIHFIPYHLTCVYILFACVSLFVCAGLCDILWVDWSSSSSPSWLLGLLIYYIVETRVTKQNNDTIRTHTYTLQQKNTSIFIYVLVSTQCLARLLVHSICEDFRVYVAIKLFVH